MRRRRNNAAGGMESEAGVENVIKALKAILQQTGGGIGCGGRK